MNLEEAADQCRWVSPSPGGAVLTRRDGLFNLNTQGEQKHKAAAGLLLMLDQTQDVVASMIEVLSRLRKSRQLLL